MGLKLLWWATLGGIILNRGSAYHDPLDHGILLLQLAKLGVDGAAFKMVTPFLQVEGLRVLMISIGGLGG